MASLVLYLAATVLFAQSTVAFNCSIPPIYVDIHKRAVHNSAVFQYGSFIGVGTSAQNQSLWPSLSQNHTSFTDRDYCNKNSTSLKNCPDSTGGFFIQQDSSTYVRIFQHQSQSASNSDPRFQNTSSDFRALDNNRNGSFTGTYGQDTIRLYTHYFETDGASQTLLENSTIEIASRRRHHRQHRRHGPALDGPPRPLQQRPDLRPHLLTLHRARLRPGGRHGQRQQHVRRIRRGGASKATCTNTRWCNPTQTP